ncbi:30934_t:CDS:2 [Racocetra persica]|uniref:30934_t:CDS:1 n=1 Tax=Racocetra persica TaxID=160502 RepID=A0ACA9NVJ4_9GLOM|nr:30934_t:CDS:2 [Racocetra persica]
MTSQTDVTSETKAIDLPCIFIFLATKYSNNDLLKCGINEKQRWRNASSMCGKDNIDNSKCKCPQCNTKLPTITEIQQEIDQTISKKRI